MIKYSNSSFQSPNHKSDRRIWVRIFKVWKSNFWIWSKLWVWAFKVKSWNLIKKLSFGTIWASNCHKYLNFWRSKILLLLIVENIWALNCWKYLGFWLSKIAELLNKGNILFWLSKINELSIVENIWTYDCQKYIFGSPKYIKFWLSKKSELWGIKNVGVWLLKVFELSVLEIVKIRKYLSFRMSRISELSTI